MEHLGFGLSVSALGMGLVFGLLVLLWALLTLLLRLDRREAGVTDRAEQPAAGDAGTTAPARAAPVASVKAPDSLAPDLAAAMLIAVRLHKEIRRQQAAPAMRIYWPGSLLYASRWVGAGRVRQTQGWQRRGT